MNLPIARFLSFILNPLMVIVLVPFFLIYKTTGDILAAVQWTFYTLIFLVMLGAFILFMVRRGKFTDYDVSKREQRPILFLVTMLLSALYVSGLFIFAAPSILFVVTLCIMAGIILASVVNNWIKASMHVATITALIAAIAMVYDGYYYFLLLLIPLVGYIRVRAKRHTIPETIAGAILGLGLSLMMYVMVTSVLE